MRFFGYFCDNTKIEVVNELSSVLFKGGRKSNETLFGNMESIGATTAHTTFNIEG